MASSVSIRNVFTQQMLATIFGLVALGFGLLLSFNQGNPVVIGFMGLFTAIVGLLFVSQVRTSIQEAQYKQ